MADENFNYTVRCRTCRTQFKVQLFESHQKNLFLVDNKDWYCDKCKQAYFRKQAETLSEAHQARGLPELKGTPKMISWAEKIRAELINKLDYLRNSLKFNSDDERELSAKVFEIFLKEWQQKNEAKWWIDNRKMTVRDISNRIGEISETIKA